MTGIFIIENVIPINRSRTFGTRVTINPREKGVVCMLYALPQASPVHCFSLFFCTGILSKQVPALACFLYPRGALELNFGTWDATLGELSGEVLGRLFGKTVMMQDRRG